MRLGLLLVAGLMLASSAATYAVAQDKSIVVASTTEAQDSGLFDFILPMFTQKTGIVVNVIAQGTGRALDAGRRGDADVLFVHDSPEERKFIAEGWGIKRFDVMYDDFVLLGPKSDPIRLAGSTDIVLAMKTIAEKGAQFVSRGDRSGTNAAELRYWKQAELDPATTKPSWYYETGKGMASTLIAANEMGAYLLSDRGVWLLYKSKTNFIIAVEGDHRLFNPFGLILVNPAMHPNVKAELGQQFVDWMMSPEGQGAIASYKVDGEQLYFPMSPALNASVR